MFMKLKFTILFLLFSAMILPLYAQNLPILPDSGKDVKDFVPINWKIADQLEGDLNSDGLIETVLVLQGANQELIKESEYFDYNVMIRDEMSGDLKMMADNNPVVLAVLSKENCGYKLTAQNNQLIPLFNGGWYRWKHSVSLENKTLKVELNGKVSSAIMDNFGETKRIYKFQTKNSKLVLTEAEETFWSQAMLVRNGRRDRYQKYDFLKFTGLISSTVSFDKQPAKQEIRAIESLIPFEQVTANSIEDISKIPVVEEDIL